MSVFGDRPSPATSEALDKVFEIAREHFGCLDATEAEDWRVWLDVARPYMRFSAHRQDIVETETTVTRTVERSVLPGALKGRRPKGSVAVETVGPEGPDPIQLTPAPAGGK